MSFTNRHDHGHLSIHVAREANSAGPVLRLLRGILHPALLSLYSNGHFIEGYEYKIEALRDRGVLGDLLVKHGATARQIDDFGRAGGKIFNGKPVGDISPAEYLIREAYVARADSEHLNRLDAARKAGLRFGPRDLLHAGYSDGEARNKIEDRLKRPVAEYAKGPLTG